MTQQVLPWRRHAFATVLAVWGPGVLVMLADTDVGNVVAAAQAGTRWGYRLLPLPLLLIPLLYMVQELTVRLGLFAGPAATGQGFAATVRARCGMVWAWLALVALAVSTFGSIVTEFVGIAGVGEMYGVSRWQVLPLAALGLLSVILTGSYRRIERIAAVIGLFELSFLAVAYAAHPRATDVLHDIVRQPLADPSYLYLGAALVGATFNPWMIFYQSSAVAEKRLGAMHHAAARWDTAAGAMVTQVLTVAVLVAASATLGAHGGSLLDGVGRISEALTPVLGDTLGRLAFGVGVSGAALVAAIVCSLGFAWGCGEIVGGARPRRWFVAAYVACILGGMAVVLFAPDLVWLTILTQVTNAVLLPVVVGLLVVIAARHLPPQRRLRGPYLWLVAGTAAVVSALGLLGAVAGAVS